MSATLNGYTYKLVQVIHVIQSNNGNGRHSQTRLPSLPVCVRSLKVHRGRARQKNTRFRATATQAAAVAVAVAAAAKKKIKRSELEEHTVIYCYIGNMVNCRNSFSAALATNNVPPIWMQCNAVVRRGGEQRLE